jgi:hypothetical protein
MTAELTRVRDSMIEPQDVARHVVEAAAARNVLLGIRHEALEHVAA